MRGREGGGDEISRQRCLAGGHPSNLLMYSDFSPFVLGMLLALYEHRVFVEGVLWGRTSGVSRGGRLLREICRGFWVAEARP